ncbi:MAG: TetR/AcrR family transcriptional regulator [Anaerolineae bacterium]|jgi:AcrR family transcriptional regulator|nr:TetR/AcrR family transcriptional regulator [Anaerolineae bacterium]
MRTPEEDLRVKRTEKALRNALMSLVGKKGYDAITIQDIVDEAETSRVTFYRHYRDKNELLNACLDTIYDELIQCLEPCSLVNLNPEKPPILILYKYLEQNLDLYRAILNSQGSAAIHKRIRDYLAQAVYHEIVEELTMRQLLNKTPIPIQLVSLQVAVGELGLVLWWMDNPTAYSAEYMAQVSHRMNFWGVLEGLGIRQTPTPLA